jgi:hypothetical protein
MAIPTLLIALLLAPLATLHTADEPLQRRINPFSEIPRNNRFLGGIPEFHGCPTGEINGSDFGSIHLK